MIRLAASTVILVVVVSTPPPLKHDLPADKRLRQEILGSWIVPRDSSDYAPAFARETFYPDGTYSVYFFDTPDCTHVAGQIDATWTIDNGVLTSKTTKVSPDNLGTVGDVVKDEIISFDSVKMVLHSLDDGSTYSRARSSGCLDTGNDKNDLRK